MKNKYKKFHVLLILCFVLLSFTGCVDESKVYKVAAGGVFQSSSNTLDFMCSNNYNSKDITDITYNEEQNSIEYKFTLKSSIKVSITLNTDKLLNNIIITAPEDANVEDLVNCLNFAYSYSDRNKNKDIFKNAIVQAVKSKGEKITIPIKNDDKLKENYVLVNDKTVYICIVTSVK